MQGTRLQLGQKWLLGERIGRGGFGQVYVATSAGGSSAVVKLVPREPGAERELLFVDLSGVRNVVPIIDSGETADHYVLVMPRAEQSLRQYLEDAAGRRLGVSAAVGVLLDIVAALADLDGRVVHRDLKPENVLLLDGHWCLADFGISRYAEATTAPDTQKYALSPPYAAPERWRNERATIATDIYAFGVMAYELLFGSPPFAGPSLHDFREQHLHHDPEPLEGVPRVIAALVEECLYKAPATRPRPSNIAARLSKAVEPPLSGGLARLQQAGHAEAVRLGKASREASQQQSEAERRTALFEAASKSLLRIGDSLKQTIVEVAPAAVLMSARDGWRVRLNQAELWFESLGATQPNPWGSWGPVGLEVIAHGQIILKIPEDRYQYAGRAHSLWFCDARETESFQWFELAFMVSPLLPQRGRRNPLALPPGQDSAKALSTGMNEFQLGWPFTPLSPGDEGEFVDRWAGWLAAAAEGELRHPSHMPERSTAGSWRRG